MKLSYCFYSILFAGALCGSGAQAQSLSADVLMELQSESGVDSSNDDNHRTNMFFRTEVAPTLTLNDRFYIDGTFVLEPVRDPEPGDDLFFEDEGIYAEEIKLNFIHGPWHVFAGKFNPAFGFGWEWGRGIWGEDFAEDYEITEKIGFGVAHAFETETMGTHTLTGSTFFADTTVLSQSIIRGRGTVEKEDGGASNTEDFSSFVAGLDGDNVAGVDGLYYKLGYRFLGEGDADHATGGADESGWVATLGHRIGMSDRVDLDLFAEYTDIQNFGGVDGEDRDYLSGSAKVIMDERWNLTLAHTMRNIDVSGADDIDDHLTQVSAGYDFQNGLTLEAGWKNTEEDNVDDHIIGFLARYQFGL